MRISDWSSDVCSSDLTVARLGIVTDTDDADGRSLRERPVPALSIDTIDAALRALTGRILQRPPIYSALKRGGEPLYAKARRGEVVEVEEREVDVHAFELQSAADLRSEEHTSELQSLMRISYAVFCWKKKQHAKDNQRNN